jgi:ABC-type branched-subunit amino acid transport system substrate-binding protein
VAAVEELVAVHRVIAIIGPMDARAAAAAAAVAQARGVPLLSLSPAPAAEAVTGNVYRMFGTPAQELQALLAQARSEGRSRVAALLPEGPYGDLMETLLRAQVKPAGASVVVVQRYPNDTTSFVEQAQALSKQSFDALLLADGPEHVTLIAPALAAAGLWCAGPKTQAPPGTRAIGVLAPAVAFEPGLARSVGRYLQGVLFSVQFDADIAQGSARTFADRFQAQFGEQPDAFAALAHDAYKLVRAAVAQGAKSRQALADALPNVASTELAGPSRGLAPNHEPRRATRLLRLTGESFDELDSAQ